MSSSGKGSGAIITRESIRPLVWECLGTLALGYTIGTAGTHTAASGAGSYDPPLIGLSIGTILSVMVYAGGAISGGHYNPAVTLACVLRGVTSIRTGLFYWAAQVTGALAAGALALLTRGSDNAGYPELSLNQTYLAGFVMEFFFSLFLVLAVLNTATAEATKGNNYFGLAIGWAVFVGATCIGPYTGAALNPAIGIGLPLVVAGKINWIHIAGPFAAGVIGAIKHLVSHPPYEDLPHDAISGFRTVFSQRYSKVMSAIINEFTGTFYLCLTIGFSAAGFNGNIGNSAFAPLAIGASLMIAVYFGGHISGGHYNPAVTFGLTLIGKCKPVKAATYIAAQVGASFAAGVLSKWALDPVSNVVSCGYPDHNSMVSRLRAVLAEGVFTFFLVTAVMFTAATKRNEGNHYFGFAIGMTVFVGATAVGGVSGGAFNPAVGTGLPIICGKSATNVWIYWVGPLLGALAATGIFALTSFEDLPKSSEDRDEGHYHKLDNASNDMDIEMSETGISYAAADDVIA